MNVCFLCHSGHGRDALRIYTKPGMSSHQEEVEQAQEPSGECIIANNNSKADSIHDVKIELLRFNTEKITITLDCCRTVTRGFTDLK